MTQEAFIRQESRKHGIKRTIKVPLIAANSLLQYDRTDAKLKSGIGVFGSFNGFSCFNNDAVDIEIALDFAEEKTFPVPAGSMISMDEIDFQGFNIHETSGVGVTANKITFIAVYEPPLMREKLKSYKIRGGK